jgi:hypothetical protein
MTSPLIFDELKALQQSLSAIGTFRTWPDVRVESVMRSKADIG